MAGDNSTTASSISKYILIALLLTFMILYVTMKSASNSEDTRRVYYYDETNNTVFLASAGLIPPIKAPSQQASDPPAGVRAYLFACESCAPSYDGMTLDQVNNNGGFIAWLEKYTDEGQKVLSEQNAADVEIGFEAAAQYKLIRSPGNSQWVPAESRAGNMIRASLQSRCGKGSPRVCRPTTE